MYTHFVNKYIAHELKLYPQAIHDGLNCKQYQDHMKADSDTNVDARRTRDMLDEMVDRGEAMVSLWTFLI